MREDPLAARQNKNLLFDFYGALLTEKQRDIFAMYTVEDCSFSEIGKELGITPQAVADVIKRATMQLTKYEESLGLVQKFLTQKQAIETIETALQKLETINCAGMASEINIIKASLKNLTL